VENVEMKLKQYLSVFETKKFKSFAIGLWCLTGCLSIYFTLTVPFIFDMVLDDVIYFGGFPIVIGTVYTIFFDNKLTDRTISKNVWASIYYSFMFVCFLFFNLININWIGPSSNEIIEGKVISKKVSRSTRGIESFNIEIQSRAHDIVFIFDAINRDLYDSYTIGQTVTESWEKGYLGYYYKL
jgi:hypothetical protein